MNHYSPNTDFNQMSDKTFARFSNFIHSELGIKMPPAKRTMLQTRLQKRLRRLGIGSYDDYYDYVFSPEGMKSELREMINVVTTNKTDFFREPRHFEFLINSVLPQLYDSNSQKYRKKMVIWSSACSSGEEPYTLAMVLSEYAEKHPGFQFSILATDISTKVLERAKTGIYDEQKVDPVPMGMKKKYLLRSKEKNKGLVRIIPELRSLINFYRINLVQGDLGIGQPVDVIFCRNVIIYFDRPTQEIVLNRLVSNLKKGGYIFMGHSETLSGINVPLVSIDTTVYRKI